MYLSLSVYLAVYLSISLSMFPVSGSAVSTPHLLYRAAADCIWQRGGMAISSTRATVCLLVCFSTLPARLPPTT